jgi:hypothetical protein
VIVIVIFFSSYCLLSQSRSLTHIFLFFEASTFIAAVVIYWTSLWIVNTYILLLFILNAVLEPWMVALVFFKDEFQQHHQYSFISFLVSLISLFIFYHRANLSISLNKLTVFASRSVEEKNICVIVKEIFRAKEWEEHKV